jgi:hypothetical protein
VATGSLPVDGNLSGSSLQTPAPILYQEMTMTEKPTYEALAKRVQELEQAEFERNKAMVLLRESEARHRMKLDNILLPEGDMGALGLADIMDTKSIQSMMDDFYNLSHIGVALLDLHGKILVATGWQDICTQFHRVHPETCTHCRESDIHLSNGVEPGTFRLYRCKNNMWDIATPITVGVANAWAICFWDSFYFQTNRRIWIFSVHRPANMDSMKIHISQHLNGCRAGAGKQSTRS